MCGSTLSDEFAFRFSAQRNLAPPRQGKKVKPSPAIFEAVRLSERHANREGPTTAAEDYKLHHSPFTELSAFEMLFPESLVAHIVDYSNNPGKKQAQDNIVAWPSLDVWVRHTLFFTAVLKRST